jgi:ankyrin repeat protein
VTLRRIVLWISAIVLAFCALLAARGVYALYHAPLSTLIVCADGEGVGTPLQWMCRQGLYAVRVNAPDVEELNRSAGASLAVQMNDKAEAEKLLRFFVARGVDINSADTVYTHSGFTALHAAVLANSPAEARLLMANGAKIDVRDKQGRTALELAQFLQERRPAEDRAQIIKTLTGSSI